MLTAGPIIVTRKATNLLRKTSLSEQCTNRLKPYFGPHYVKVNMAETVPTYERDKIEGGKKIPSCNFNICT